LTPNLAPPTVIGVRRLVFTLGVLAPTLSGCGHKGVDPSCETVGKHLATFGKEGDDGLGAFRTDQERTELAHTYAQECAAKHYDASVRRCLVKANALSEIAKCTAGSATSKNGAGLEVQRAWVVNGDRVSVQSVAATATGSIAVAGIVTGKGSFAGTDIVNATDLPFVAALTERGTLTWVRTAKLPSSAVHVAMGADGAVWLSGSTLKSSKELGPEFRVIGNPRVESPTSFLVAWSPTGDVTHQLAIAGVHHLDIALASDGDVITASTAVGKVDVGGGPRECGGSGLLLARFHADGAHVWSTCASSPTDFAPSAEQQTTANALVVHDATKRSD
jgi:hypothetical protein